MRERAGRRSAPCAHSGLRWRRIAAAALGAATIALTAGCGAAAQRSQPSFAGCQQFTTSGGTLVASLAVAGAACAQADVVAADALAARASGGTARGPSISVSGWRCQFFPDNQLTCLRGADTLYAQYTTS